MSESDMFPKSCPVRATTATLLRFFSLIKLMADTMDASVETEITLPLLHQMSSTLFNYRKG
jgi:hypothetical protein